MAPGSWVLGNAFTDTTTSNIEQGLLFPYVRALAVYRCPADKSTVRDKGQLPRTRHYAMSDFMNGKNTSGALVDAWVFHKASEITKPTQTGAFVFIHEHAPASIDMSEYTQNHAGSSLI